MNKMSKINKLFIILIMILMMIVVIYNYSYKSTFKLRRSIPMIYFNGDIFSEYGAIGNPNMLRGNQGSLNEGTHGSLELPPFQGSYNYNYKAPNADMLLYGQNAPYVNNNFNAAFNPSASIIYNSLY